MYIPTLSGLSFWFEESNEGFFESTSQQSVIIFFYEALALTSACVHILPRLFHGAQLLIYCDNSNTVNIFNSLRCFLEFNPLAKLVVDLCISK